jgi:hypothetical protein
MMATVIRWRELTATLSKGRRRWVVTPIPGREDQCEAFARMINAPGRPTGSLKYFPDQVLEQVEYLKQELPGLELVSYDEPPDDGQPEGTVC